MLGTISKAQDACNDFAQKLRLRGCRWASGVCCRAMKRVWLVLLSLLATCGGSGGPALPRRPIDDVAIDQTVKTRASGAQLAARVDIARDKLGIPHLYARSEHDLFFGNGWIEAHDRLMQMQVFRYIAAGRLSELFGALQEDVIDGDITMRVHRIRALAEDSVAVLRASKDPTDLAIVDMLDAYADGVNAYVEALRRREFTLAEAIVNWFDVSKWEPWTAADSIAIGRLQQFSLSEDEIEVELTRAREMWTQVFDNAAPGTPEKLRSGGFADLYQTAPMDATSTIDGWPNVGTDTGTRAFGLSSGARVQAPEVPLELLDGLRRSGAGYPWLRLATNRSIGSNNWVVAGKLTASGQPILANDTHLPMLSPSIWYQLQLSAPASAGAAGVDVEGVAFPGIPGIMIGQNQHLAWGATVAVHDVTDLYKEDIVACAAGGGDCVKFMGREVPLESRMETFKIGANGTIVRMKTFKLETVPHHGPLSPLVVNHEVMTRSGPGTALSIRYTGHDVSEDVRTFYKLLHAKDQKDAFAAFKDFTFGAFNWVFVDDGGNIGWTQAAKVPRRPAACMSYDRKTNRGGSAPFLVQPGDGSCEWLGYLDPRYIPHAVNPDKGYLVTANADPVGETFDNNPLNGPMVRRRAALRQRHLRPRLSRGPHHAPAQGQDRRRPEAHGGGHAGDPGRRPQQLRRARAALHRLGARAARRRAGGAGDEPRPGSAGDRAEGRRAAPRAPARRGGPHRGLEPGHAGRRVRGRDAGGDRRQHRDQHVRRLLAEDGGPRGGRRARADRRKPGDLPDRSRRAGAARAPRGRRVRGRSLDRLERPVGRPAHPRGREPRRHPPQGARAGARVSGLAGRLRLERRHDLALGQGPQAEGAVEDGPQHHARPAAALGSQPAQPGRIPAPRRQPHRRCRQLEDRAGLQLRRRRGHPLRGRGPGGRRARGQERAARRRDLRSARQALPGSPGRLLPRQQVLRPRLHRRRGDREPREPLGPDALMKVLVTSALPVDVRPWLGGAEVVQPAAGRLSREELLAAVAGVDGLVCLLLDRIDEELLGRAPRLRVVGNVAVGVDNIDLVAAARRGVAVANTPGVLTEATADLTLALLLAVARRVCEGDRLARSGAWTGWEPGQLLGSELAGRTLGLIGFGRIGQAVARRARGFGLTVVYAAPRDAEGAEARRVPLGELLASADFVSLHVPLTAATRGMIGAAELARMKAGAILLNTARGPCVDEAALADALASGHLGGAGLDVYADEPAIHPGLRAHPRTVLLPHLGSATVAARSRMAELAARAVGDVLAGRVPPNLVRA